MPRRFQADRMHHHHLGLAAHVGSVPIIESLLGARADVTRFEGSGSRVYRCGFREGGWVGRRASFVPFVQAGDVLVSEPKRPSTVKAQQLPGERHGHVWAKPSAPRSKTSLTSDDG